MNQEIILSMVKPYIKDSAITYDEFDGIFSMLSRKEQYAITDILFENGINLIDKHVSEDIIVFDIDDANAEETMNEKLQLDSFEILYDKDIFKDETSMESPEEYLVYHRNIQQLNETLCILIQQGNRQAAQDLCVKNKRLVDKYVNAYIKRYGYHLDFEDLEQVGFIGLLKAAEKFDVQKGLTFSTYAVHWIKQAISRDIMDNGYMIRIPVHMMERINKVVRIHNKLVEEEIPLHERVMQIAAEMECSEDDIRECLMLKSNFLTYTSLDVNIGEDKDTALAEFVPKEEASVEDLVLKSALRREIEVVLATLSPKEKDILKLRNGWDDDWNRTLEEVGKKYNVTRERIRQIEAKAIRKMRHSSRSRRLRVFLED